MDMRKLARQLKTKQLSVDRVIFESNNEKLVFESPVVVEANMMGQKVYQIFGEPKKHSSVSEEDVQILMEKTGCDRDTAIKTLEKTGDLAEGILLLMENEQS